MKPYELLNESPEYLSEARTYRLWENAGRKLYEADLTADQINQIFAQAEKGAGRTMLGKGMDAASAVNKAWEDLKTKVQNSGPIKNVDAMYDQAADKLKQATGGDQGVMKYVQKYRDFAKKHPIAQSLIYSALIAAAGISGAGLGGAAALGLFKLVDKLLQGEKFSSAAYQGAKTGAMAYGASKLADLIKGKPEGEMPGASDAAAATKAAGTMSVEAAKALRQEAGNAAIKAINDAIANGEVEPSQISVMAGIAKEAMEKYGTNVGGKLNLTTLDIIAEKAAMQVAKRAGALEESIELNEATVKVLFSKISLEQTKQINEGIMDTLKGAAGKAASAVSGFGKRLTNKVTSDQLMKAWKAAGSPTDSAAVAKIMGDAGVPQEVVSNVYTSMKIPVSPSTQAAAPAVTPTAAPTTPAGAPSKADFSKSPAGYSSQKMNVPQATMPAVGTAPSSEPADAIATTTPSGKKPAAAPEKSAAATIGMPLKDLKQFASKLRSRDRQALIAFIQKTLETPAMAEDLDEGQIYSTGGGAGEGQRWYKPKSVPNQNELKMESAILRGYLL